MQQEESIFIDTPDGRLEGRWRCPDSARGRVVFSHPHPAFGGTMDYPAVRLACHYLNQSGYATLRYNFRGVGASDGEYSNGVGERNDLMAAVEFSGRNCADLPLILAGYSFGAWISWLVAEELPLLSGLVLVSPPFGALDFEFPPLGFKGPTLALIGDRDDFCPTGVFQRSIKELAPHAENEIWTGNDHFWLGLERKLATRIEEFLGKMA